MTSTLRLIGYWSGPEEPTDFPDVRAFVATEQDAATEQSVAAYLRSGTIFVAAAGTSTCRLCGLPNGSTERTDGHHFVWPDGLAHYVETHHVRLPPEVVSLAATTTPDPVDPDAFEQALFSGDLTIDLDWWRSLRTDAAPEGCG
ncbi:hypothetical protein Adu01nite_54770 [Paractinoplanes durhamensis]|uniref:Uncharacterized protein n=1 Tax=Paractinoplanes durhamensis TaxID=113563 RepID=A0ABQ3Z2S9_9ACTN|nr:hypothetical protein [Actinoplanes durhamensis]GIE04127.1 hypothetical protein Adu01nite_54770 [Actinoplanes durhamensis]